MAGKFSSLADIQLETPLADILSSSEVVEELKVLGADSAIKKNIYNRQFALNSSGTSGALSDSIIINNQYNSATYADALIGQFDICGQAIEKFVRDVSSLSEQQEYAELSTLRKLVSDKISAIQEEIAALDENADDYDSKVADKRHEMLRFDIKLGKIDARIAKLDPSITGAGGAGAGAGAGTDAGTGTSGTSAQGTGARVVNTGSDDNNHNYGAESDFGIEQLKGLTASSYRYSNWKLVEGKRIGLNGEIVDSSDPNYELYNQYYECEYGGKKVYVICSDLYNGDNYDTNMKQSSPILYITQDDNGHTLCYDKNGQAVSYNTGMNILDINRCSYYRSMKSVTNFPDSETKKPVATPCAPTRTDTLNQKSNGDYEETTTWGDSAPDADGNKWTSYSNMTFDESETFGSLNLDDSINDYTVFRKDKGDMGKINVLIKTDNTHEKYFSIQQPDGTYLYYDSSCNPVSEQEVLNHII